MLVDEIRKQYKEAEPIFVNDLKTDDISRPALTQQLGTLCRNHVIEKFDNGIYYIPKKSRLQNSVGPSADTIARYKYVTDGKTVKGFYSGYTFANQLGITTQVPARVEIVSNNTSAIVREVVIGKQRFIVRKPAVKINADNVYVLQLLDIYVNAVFDTRKITNKQGLSAVSLRRKPSFLCPFSVFQRLCLRGFEPR